MKIGLRPLMMRVIVVLAISTFGALSGSVWDRALAQPEEPIAYIGHGAFFDRAGNEIPVTQAFVQEAQAWYREDMLASLAPRQRRDLTALEQQLYDGLPGQGQARLVAQQRTLDWLVASSPKRRNDDRTLGKLRALQYALTSRVPEQRGQNIGERREPFVLDAALSRKLATPQFAQPGGFTLLSATINLGQAYINECMAARVPIPPSIGMMDPNGVNGWKSQGFIPTTQQFIVGSPAEVRTYKGTNPAGMCYALPRYSDAGKATVALDGVICLSQETSKVCFWDNQMSGNTFSFPAGTQIPIGVANTAVDPSGRYQAGGFELLGGAGGVCTDCHAGENPYITHPRADLGGGVLWESLSGAPQNLPTFAPNRYDPLVAAAWPQNQLSQAGPTLPNVCKGCHVKGGAGRFPHLSNELPGYCGTILTKAFSAALPPATMPPANPGGSAAAGTAFKNSYCGAPPNAASADAGDPHLTTTNGVHYDFQAAGEFVALKNSDTGFELQARQSPVQTTFTPPANAYSGLASCVSLNTAVAVRVGKHRVTYQPALGSAGKAEQMQLRVDGTLVTASATPIDLGAGNMVAKAASGGGLDVKIADGTEFTVTPQFWTSQGYWYLDVDVRRTPAREGTMGPVLPNDWLPRAPSGTSFGPLPASLADRHIVLNQRFANAWRVNAAISLFDYAAGTSTANFTDANWPPESGQPCKTALPSNAPLTRMQPELAQTACRGIKDAALLANCLFDVTVMGERAVANGYVRADKLKTNVPR